MKKVLAFILAALMVLSLAACTGGETTKAPGGDKTTVAPTEKPTEKPTDKPTDAPTDPVTPPAEVIEVKYYCTVGAYLIRLQELVEEFNNGIGKEKGIKINLESEINDSDTVFKANMEAGNYPDMFSSSSPNLEYYGKGYYVNLYDIDNAEMKELVAKRQPYIDLSPSVYSVPLDHFLTTLPLEVLPIKMPINTDLFEEAGVEEPKTWDDVLVAAQKITELGKENTRGFGWSTWSAVWRRLTFKSTIPSARKAWWDPNTATYDWTQYRPVIEALCKLYSEGWMIGADDLKIDPIRNAFSDGQVGMFISPAYDYSVFTNQFPATCNWKFIDMPVYNEGNQYKGCYFTRGGDAICGPAWEQADDAKKAAICTVYCYINGDYCVQEIAKIGGIITFPGEFPDLKLNDDLGEQFKQMADTEGYYIVPVYPDGASGSKLEGDNYATVFSAVMHGEVTLDAAFTDLATRYNAAYQAAKADPDLAPNMAIYEYDYVFKGN